jgi:hypothetical protein
LHLVDGRGNFIAVKAVVDGTQTVNGTLYVDGTVLFSTPGFSGPNGLPTITCTTTSPLSDIKERVTLHRSELGPSRRRARTTTSATSAAQDEMN